MQKRPKKRIHGLAPEMPVCQGARRVLSTRLRAVEFYLPLAHRRYSDDVEYVHQLRVSTRQSGAALRVFADLLPRKRAKKVGTRMQKIRRAAGIARDADVQRLYFRILEDGASKEEKPALAMLCAWIERKRKKAQKQIKRIAKEYPIRRLRRGRRALTDALHDVEIKQRLADEHELVADGASHDLHALTLSEFASIGLPRVLAGVSAAAERDLSAPEHLHDLRVHLKRLRYALEAFGPGVGSSGREAVESLKWLQDTLGEINDHDARIHCIEEFLSEMMNKAMRASGRSAFYEQLLQTERSKLEEDTAAFLCDWNAGWWHTVLLRLQMQVGWSGRPRVDDGQLDSGDAAA